MDLMEIVRLVARGTFHALIQVKILKKEAHEKHTLDTHNEEHNGLLHRAG